jgi:hypothetical protein
MLPALGLFYYEPNDAYPAYSLASAEVAQRFDFSATHSRATTLPVTLVCPWGRDVADFLAVTPPAATATSKTPGRLLAYFSEHGVAAPHRRFIDELFEAAGADAGSRDDGLHAFIHRRNRDTPPEVSAEPYQLANRIAFVATYRFVLITEGQEEEDFLSPEWSQAFLSGTVPVYLGAPNIEHYAPGPRSFVNARDFSTGGELWAYLQQFAAPAAAPAGDEAAEAAVRAAGEARERAYGQFFRWKEGAAAAYEKDEGLQHFAVGTGQALVPDAEWPRSKDDVAHDLVSRWPLPLRGRAGAAPEDDPPPESEAARDFAEVSAWGWRLFREKLDRCVHYAECRVCRLVWGMT